MADEQTTVDQLAIKIAANADTAAASIDKLTASLTRLRGALSGAMSGMSKFSPQRVSAPYVKSANTALRAAGAAVPSVATPAASGEAAAATTAAAAKAAASVASVEAPMSRLQTISAKVKGAVGRVTGGLRDMGVVGNKATKSLGSSFIQLRSSIFFAFFVLGAFYKLAKSTIGAASEATEKMHLFGAVFGEAGAAANDYVQSLTRVLGIDPIKFGEYYSTFFSMAAGMGMASEAANTLSKNYTQLVYDYASLRDMSFEDVAVKFRSALAGQTRSIIQFGLDITQASLQQEIYREGLNYSIKDLTKADKAILAHNYIIRRTGYLQGDLARTLSQPANMVRIMKDQFIIAGRAIGQIFIPVLQAVLPWLILLARAIANAAQSIAAFFGIKAKGWEDFATDISAAGGGTDDLYGGMEDVGNATGKAAKAAKKLKDYILGIDELNVLSPETPDTGSGGGGGGGGGGGAGVGIKPFDVYDMIGGAKGLDAILAPTLAKLEQFKDAIRPFTDAFKRMWDAFKPFAGNVFDGFKSFFRDTLVPLAAWTLNTAGVRLLDTFTKALNWFNEHPETAQLIGKVLAALLLLKGLDSTIGIIARFGGMMGGVFGLPNIARILGGALGGFVTFSQVLIGLFTNTMPAGISAGGGVMLTGLAQLKAGLLTKLASLGGALTGIIAKVATALSISTGGAVAVIILAIGAIIAAGYTLYKHWDDIKARFQPLVDAFRLAGATLQTTLGPAITAVATLWGTFGDALGEVGAAIWSVVGPAFKEFGSFLESRFTANVMDVIDVINFVGIVLLRLVGLIAPATRVVAGFATVVVEAFRAALAAARGDGKGVEEAYQRARDAAGDAKQGASDFGDVLRGKLPADSATGSAALDKVKGVTWGVNDAFKGAKDSGDKAASSIGGVSLQSLLAQSTVDGLTGKVKSLADATLDVRNADIANRQSQLDLKQAREDHAKAIRDFGVDSDEAKGAQLRLEQAEIRADDAAKNYLKSVNTRSAVEELEKLATAWNRLISAIREKAAITINTRLAAGANISGGIRANAVGSMNPTGSLFLAGEAGPELVGRYGGNSNTVMPLENSGFVEAMASAVFSATVAAMSSAPNSGGSGDVYLNGQVVGQILRDDERRSGIGASLVKVSI